MKGLLNSIYDFVKDHDFLTVVAAFRKLEWSQMAKSAYTWFIILPLLTYLLWTKKYKIITAIASFFLFLLLIQKTLSPSGGTLSLPDLLIFLSGAVVLVGLNLYLLFIRE